MKTRYKILLMGALLSTTAVAFAQSNAQDGWERLQELFHKQAWDGVNSADALYSDVANRWLLQQGSSGAINASTSTTPSDDGSGENPPDYDNSGVGLYAESCIGVAIHTVSFEGTIIHPYNQPAQRWDWVFGDGSATSTTSRFASRTYSLPGTYNAYVTAFAPDEDGNIVGEQSNVVTITVVAFDIDSEEVYPHTPCGFRVGE